VLTITQRRYGNDLAPSASVAFAILLAQAPRFALGRTALAATSKVRLSLLASLLVTLGLFSPTLLDYVVPRLQSGFAAIRGIEVPANKGMELISQNVSRFARDVRRNSPETDGFLNSRRVPQYGILADANIGHVLHYIARRATATDPMWAYIGQENWDRSAAFFREMRESKGIEIAASLEARYLVTTGGAPVKTIAGRLHNADGTTSTLGPRLAHFRLITESEPGRVGFGILLPQNFQQRNRTEIAFKLFEIVKGALLEFEAPPGERVTISLLLTTPSGRSIVYRAAATVGREGYVRIRVPYPTDDSAPVRAVENYRIQIGAHEIRLDVSERQVRNGSRVVAPSNGES
jgi:hypothetical protein